MVGRGIVDPEEAARNGSQRMRKLLGLPPGTKPPSEAELPLPLKRSPIDPEQRERLVGGARRQTLTTLKLGPKATPEDIRKARERLAEEVGKHAKNAEAALPPLGPPSPSAAPGIPGRVAEILSRVLGLFQRE